MYKSGFASNDYLCRIRVFVVVVVSLSDHLNEYD